LADVPWKALQPIIIYLKIEFPQHFSGFISAIWLNPQKEILKALGPAYHSFVTIGERERPNPDLTGVFSIGVSFLVSLQLLTAQILN